MTPRERLQERSEWVRAETLRLHARAPETRIASSLSDVEILVALYYGGFLDSTADNQDNSERDHLIVSKAHGAVSLYPILADRGFFSFDELQCLGRENGLLTAMPDCNVPGIETINGSLGHGLGVACGIALGKRIKGLKSTVFVVCGDGELNSGAVWEAVMFAAHHRLVNVILIVDNNRTSMLGRQKDILALDPLEDKFTAFGWVVRTCDGHDLDALCETIAALQCEARSAPGVLIANTVKGKGVLSLEDDPLCHVRSLRPEYIEEILNR